MHCPVCSENEWHQTGTRTQKAADERWNSGYPKIQKAVFFDLWHTNEKIVEMKRCVCKKCGFVIDLPRPDEQEVDNKYQHLAVVEKDIGSSRAISPKAMKQEHKQAIDILDMAKSHLEYTSDVLDILDYGGGAGHLLIPMKERDHNCYLVDYNKSPMVGITRLGNTLEDIPGGHKFDLIMCRHVFEHVASPKKLAAGFMDYLRNKGLVYAEVPVELFGATRPKADPVTHINYFQKDSFCILFESVGFVPIISRQRSTTYHGRRSIVAQILARKGPCQGKNISYGNSFEKTISLMTRSYFTRLRIRMRHPLRFGRSLIRHVRKITLGKENRRQDR